MRTPGKTKLPAKWRAATYYSIVLRCFHLLHDHVFKQDLKRHGMAAPLVSKEEFAVAGKYAIVVAHVMVIIIPMEGQVELVEFEVMPVLCIAFCLFKLAD